MEVPEDSQSRFILDANAFEVASRILDALPGPIAFEDFGPYRIERPIGEGGMGEVFLARDESADRWVAIKFLRRAWAEPDLRERFTREIKTLGGLEHPFIARLYDIGTHPNGTPYFIMEYVEGKPLDEHCRERVYSVEERLRLFRSVCEAVQYAHSRLVVHRDLKPSNILIKEDSTPKLLDFGIAKQLGNLDRPANQTQTELRFTRAFAAPEQLRGELVGVYTDVYALGVILYELLAGRPPYDFEGCTPVEAEIVITGAQEPDKPSAVAARARADVKTSRHISRPAWNDLDVLCLTAMKKDVRRRYPSVVELTQDIDHYLKGEPLKARPDTLGYRAGKFMSRNQRGVMASALAFVLIAGLISFFALRLARARDLADRETAITTAMNRFLADDLLGQSDPFKSGQARESFADVVNQASSRIDLQFKAQPVIAARLHETIAQAFENRFEFPQARREYSRANDLFKQSEGPLSQDAIVVNLRRAAMEARSYERGSLALAKSLVSDAEKSISSITRPRDDVKVWLLSTRGVIALIANDARAADENFAAALRQAEASSSFDEAARTRIKRTLAFSWIRLGDGAKAEPLLRDVIDTFSRTDGPDSPASLQARVNLSQALFSERKYGQAIQEANLLYPALVKKLGDDHETTLTVLGTRAASEGSLGMWNDAIRDDLTVHNIAVRKQGEISMFSIAMLSDAALSQCLAGRVAEGEANARKTFEESKQAFGARAGMTGGCSYALAICLIGANKLDEASDLLQNIDTKAVAQLSGDPTVGASIALAQGEIAARRGDYILAKRYADAAAPAFEPPGAAFAERKSLQELRAVIGSHLGASR